MKPLIRALVVATLLLSACSTGPEPPSGRFGAPVDFSGAWDAFKDVVSGVIDWVKETLLALPATILKLAGDIGLAILNGVKNGVTGLAEAVWEVIKNLPTFLTDKAKGWAGALKGIGTSILNWIKENVTGLAGKIWGQISGFAKALADKNG